MVGDLAAVGMDIGMKLIAGKTYDWISKIMSEPWLSLFFITSMVSFFSLFPSILFLRLTLDRRVRKALPADKVYNCPLDWYGGFMRAIGFGYAAILERANQYGMIDYYDGFNVKAFANRFEKTIAWIMVSSFVTLCLCILFLVVTEYFGLIEWSSSGN